MKNILLVINIILIFLVGYLYYLHFHDIKKPVLPRVQNRNGTVLRGARVAYIDLDSLQNNYTYYKKIKTEFERKQSAANDEISGMQKKYQNRAMQLQQKGATMTQPEQEAAMQEINKMQQDLQSRKQEIDNDLYNYRTYSYIFSYEPGFMFYKDSTLNITTDVITGLNELYTENKKWFAWSNLK